MKGYTRPIQDQLAYVERLITKAARTIQKSPEGHLIVRDKGSKTEWYMSRGEEGRVYLPKKEHALAQRLAQAAYAREFLKKAEAMRKELKQLEALGAERSASVMYHALSEPYEKLSVPRKQLVEAYVLPDEEFVRTWEQQAFEGKGFAPDAPMYLTEKGERVRSKSEKMIADKLFRLGLSYHYEQPIVLKGIGRLYPDFTLLDLMERCIVLLEHYGLMDDPEYRKSTFWKIDQYEMNGFPLGTLLLCSFESAEHPLDLTSIEQMLNARFW